MRVFAVLLAVVFTTGYGFAAHLAVSSVRPGQPAAARPAAPDRVWYGGSLDPITVRSGGPEPRTRPAGSHSRLLDRPAVHRVTAAS
jgi:hypothetical protein